MNEKLRKKFDGVDIIFSDKPYFISKVRQTNHNVKEIDIFTIKDNRQEVQQILKDNSHIMNENLIDNKEALRDLEDLSQKVKEFNEEFEKTAQITCKLKEDELTITIKIESDNMEKTFTYKEDDYLDDLIDYVDNIHKTLLK